MIKRNSFGFVLFARIMIMMSVFCMQPWDSQISVEKKMDSAKTLVYNNPKKSISIARQIYDNQSNSTQDKISALIILTNGYSVQYDYENALKNSFLANDLAEKSGDDLARIRTLGLIGNLYQMLQMNDKVRLYMNKAEKISQSGKIPDSLVHNIEGNIYAIKGNSYKDDLDCSFAIQFYDKAILEFKKSESTSAKKNIILVYLHKANCLLEKSDIVEAEKYYQLALSLSEKIKLGEYQIMSQIGLAKIFQKQGQGDRSINLSKEALKQSLIMENQPLIKESSLIASLVSFSNKDMEQYKYYKDIYEKTSIKIQSAEVASINKSIDYISQRKKAEEKKTYTKNIILICILSFLAIFTIAIFIIKIRLQYQKSKDFSNSL